MIEPILKTKFHHPFIPSNWVSRPHLTEQLERGFAHKLVLISAPAGFGKTLLVCAWIDKCRNLVAWLSLDKSDNDLIRFWTYFVWALRTLQPDLGEAVLEVLQTSGTVSTENILMALINEISSLPGEYCLVLDDYHLIETREIHTAIEFLLNHQPQNLHLMITTRYDPPWPLHLFRSRQEMIELRQNDLSFSVDETEKLFNQKLKFKLSAEEIGALRERTEGWAAGLQFAAISMKMQGDRASFIKGFTGSNRFIFEYLIEEVLQKQGHEIRDFLLQTSILDTLTAPLCDAVLERNNSQETLEYLERANLFLIALDDERRWYRYHHLFANLLQRQLELLPCDKAELHRRASHWLHQNSLAEEALDHALRAGDIDLAIWIIEENILPLLESSNLTKLSAWLRLIPDDRKKERSWLCCAEAWVAVNLGQFEQMHFWLASAESVLKKTLPTAQTPHPSGEYQWDETDQIKGYIALIHSTYSFFRGDFQEGVSKSREALDLFPAEDWLGTSQAWMNIALYLQRIGKIEDALVSNQKAIEILESAGKTGPRYLSPFIVRAGILLAKGKLGEAETNFNQLVQTSPQGRLLPPSAGIALSALSRIYRERNELKKALNAANKGQEISRQWGHLDFVVSSYIDKAEILLSMGDIPRAFDALEAGKREFGDFQWPSQLEIPEVEMHTLAGDLDFVIRWSQKKQLHPRAEIEYIQIGTYLVFARLLAAQSRYDEAHILLGRLEVVAEQAGAVYSLIKIKALQAVVCQGLNLHQEAMAALKKAIMLGEEENFIRAIIDAGRPIAGLLSELLRSARGPAIYLNNLLGAMPGRERDGRTAIPRLIEPLSNRETEILRLLDTQMTSNEIAETLFIAVSTARTHVKHIYKKLGVKRRFEAVQRARDLGLI